MTLRFFRCLAFSAAIGLATFSAAAEETAEDQETEELEPSGVVDYEELEPGFFRLDEWIPPALREALGAYEEGRYFAALGNTGALIASGEPEYAVDDARFLHAMTLVALGWDDLAVPALTSVVEAKEPGGYTVLALLELVEVHDRAERWKAIADLWRRVIDRPINEGTARGKRMQKLLWEFGELRPAGPKSTRREKKLLSAPEELAVILEKRRERASDRLLYRCGQALFRVGRYEESLRAFYAVGIESPYYPYARYSIAQNHVALGNGDDAWRTLVRLGRYPKLTPEEKLLSSRARVMQAALRFENGETERGIRIARAIDEEDPEAPRARLLLTTALLDAGEPALALAYGREQIPALAEAEARQSLTIGAAYAAIGDKDSASKVYRGAAGKIRKARGEGPEAVARLRDLAEDAARERHDRERTARRHLSDGMRIVLAHDGPWNLGTLLRRIRAALGAGAYRLLARGTKLTSGKAISTSDPWVAYLESPRRRSIEAALDRLAEFEAKGSETERAFRALNADLLYLERAKSDETPRRGVARKAAALVNELRTDAKLGIPPLRLARSGSVGLEAASYRRRLAQSPKALAATRAAAPSTETARDEAASLLRDWIDEELRELLRERDEKLRALEFDLEVALSGTMVGGQPRAEKLGP